MTDKHKQLVYKGLNDIGDQYKILHDQTIKLTQSEDFPKPSSYQVMDSAESLQSCIFNFIKLLANANISYSQ